MKGTILFAVAAVSVALVTSSVYAQEESEDSAGEQQVESSAIDTVQYDEATQALTIKFDNGDIYEYKSVPKSVYDGLMSANSKGKYFNENIKGKFEYSEKSE